MIYLLFLIYLVLFSWLITKIGFIKKSGLNNSTLIFLFLAKVACGVLYGYVYSMNKADADTWQIYQLSLPEYELLLKDPLRFLLTWGDNPNNDSYSNFFGSTNSYWNAIKNVSLIKIEAIFNVFTFTNYYINVIFFAFCTFGGYIAFFRALLFIYPDGYITCVIAAFLTPSCLFWTSGFHKDGVVFALCGCIFYQIMKLYNSNNSKFKSIAIISVCYFGIFILRNYVALMMVPCFLATYFSWRHKSKTFLIFTCITVISILLFFLLPILFPNVTPPQFLITRREEFLRLNAHSTLAVSQLEPTFMSFLNRLPEAFNHGFLRPYLWENKGLHYLPFAIELILFYGSLIAYLFVTKLKSTSAQQLFFLSSLLFLCFNWLFLGYTAPVIGALIRYKSIYLPFVWSHLLYTLMSNWLLLKRINIMRK